MQDEAPAAFANVRNAAVMNLEERRRTTQVQVAAAVSGAAVLRPAVELASRPALQGTDGVAAADEVAACACHLAALVVGPITWPPTLPDGEVVALVVLGRVTTIAPGALTAAA